MEWLPDAGLRTRLAIAALGLLVATLAGGAAQDVKKEHSGAADLHFGEAVIVTGNMVLIGSPYGTDGMSPGLAYVFARTSDGWARTATLSAMGGKRGNKFGSAVAVGERTALVGAWGTDGVAPVSGSAFVFERDPNGWHQVAVLTNPDAKERHLLGYSVALDTGTAVVGAPGVNTKLWSDTTKTVPAWSGAVYIWSKEESGWQYQGRITPDSLNLTEKPAEQSGPYHLFENFGRTVAIESDLLVVGAQNGSTKAGKVYVFRRHNGTWMQEAELEQPQDSFGTAVAVSKGVVAVASSKFVFVFSRVSANWHLQAKVEPRFDSEESGFEHAGPVSIDGNVMVVGAARYKKRKGAAYIFERVGSNWNQVATITGEGTRSDSGNRAGDLFGGSVSISGETVLVGASFHDSEGPNFGAAYVFRRDSSRWLQSSKLVTPK